MTHILFHYCKLPADRYAPNCPPEGWDQQLWDRQFKAQRELAELKRWSLIQCCGKTVFNRFLFCWWWGSCVKFHISPKSSPNLVNLLKLGNHTQGWAEMCQPVQRFGVPIHCLSQAKSQVIASRFSILIRFASVLPFEYGDSDWRVAIKLIYRNMVQESRYNHCCHHKAHPTHQCTHLETGWQKLRDRRKVRVFSERKDPQYPLFCHYLHVFWKVSNESHHALGEAFNESQQ